MNTVLLPSRRRDSEDALRPSISPQSISTPPTAALRESEGIVEISNAQDALSVLKSKPSITSLGKILQFLSGDKTAGDSFHIRHMSPLSTQFIFVLVNDIVPAYWPIISRTPSQRKLLRQLIKCLRCGPGIAAVVSYLKVWSQPNPAPQIANQQAPQLEAVQHELELLECLLHGDGTLLALCMDIMQLEPSPAKRMIAADGLIGLLATGNLLSVAAQADHFLREKSKDVRKESWLSSGRGYSSWLGQSLLYLSCSAEFQKDEVKKFQSGMLAKAFRLGHSDRLLGAILQGPISGSPEDVSTGRAIIADLPAFAQPSALNTVLGLLADKCKDTREPKKYISGASALLRDLVATSDLLLNHLVDWLTSFTGGNVGFPFDLFRAVITTLSKDLLRLKETFHRSLRRFGSKRLIQQDPMLQQELQAKILILLAGYIYKMDETYLKQCKSTSLYLEAISNRLAASSTRLQFFGMAFGMAISGLVDDESSRLKFDTKDIESSEGQELRSLVKVQDSIGSITDLKIEKASLESSRPISEPHMLSLPKAASKVQGEAKIVAIEEIEDSESESEDDLPVYAKPDSDPEDSDDDPSAINRSKPTPPVYIRDLLAGLRDDDNYDRHKLAVEHAATLIRRKTGFGKEVSDHIEELAGRLSNLKNAFDLDNFHEKRLQAMIAVIVAKPQEMAQWFANTYFNGDYSMAQRAAILSALTLSARELAGLKEEDADLTGALNVPDFPSKRLPDKYEKMYQLEAGPVNKLTGKIERDIIKPMALQAADKATGPNILKVRTFSSRMEVEKRRKRPITNELAKIVAEGFFYPLTGRLTSVIRARGDSSVFTSPFLLSHFVRTLSLIIGTAGKSTLSLPGMTTEFWALLLSLRRYALTDQSILEALLFANLTLLEINSDSHRQLVNEHSQELMETQAWVQPVFENLRGGPKEEERVKMLASALLVKVKEIIEEYQQSLLGGLASGR